MATWYTQFEETDLLAFPSFLTSRWAAINSENSRVVGYSNGFSEIGYTHPLTQFHMWGKQLKLHQSTSNNARNGLEINSVAPDATEEIKAAIAVPSTSNNPALIVYGGGTSEATRSGYYFFLKPDSISLRRASNGVETTEATSTSVNTPLEQVVFVKLRAEPDGANVRVRIWVSLADDGFSAGPVIDWIDTNPLPVGWLGIGGASGSNNRDFFGQISVATGADISPPFKLEVDQWFTDYSKNAIGENPAENVSLWNDVLIQEVQGDVLSYTDPETIDVMLPNQLRFKNSTAFARSCVAMVPVNPGAASQEIYTRVVRWDPDSNNIPCLVVYGQGFGNSYGGYMLLLRQGSGNLQLRRALGGSDATLTSATLPIVADNEVLYARMSAEPEGASVRIKAWVWGRGQTQPSSPTFDYLDTSPLAVGWPGLADLSGGIGGAHCFGAVGIGINGYSAPTIPVDSGGDDAGDISSEAFSADSWAAQVQSDVSMISAAIASDQAGAIALVNQSLLDAAQATDAAGDATGAMAGVSEAATGNHTVDALASAAAAIRAGASAGESWTVQAQVLVNLVEQGAAADEIRRQTESAVTAAIESQSLAADQFIAALDTIVSLSESVSVNDAYQAVALQLASIASGAVASDSFRMLFGLQRGIQESAVAADGFSISYAFVNAMRTGGLTGDAWALMANLNASLSEVCSVVDLMSVRASTTARLTAGAVASSRFDIVNAGIRYLVMGAIILRDALQYRVNTKPALNQSVKIKPGH